MTDAWRPYVEQTAKMNPDPVVRGVFEAALSRGRGVQTAVDLGCGGGRHLALFASHGVTALGIDSCRACSHLAVPNILLGDLVRPLPFETGSVDFALMWGVFVHLPPDSHHDVFGELHRVLKPGGTLLVDILRPDDFRNALGTPMGPNYNRSPFIEGVTDLFCTEQYIEAIASSFELLTKKNLSHPRRDGRVSQVGFWLER